MAHYQHTHTQSPFHKHMKESRSVKKVYKGIKSSRFWNVWVTSDDSNIKWVLAIIPLVLLKINASEHFILCHVLCLLGRKKVVLVILLVKYSKAVHVLIAGTNYFMLCQSNNVERGKRFLLFPFKWKFIVDLHLVKKGLMCYSAKTTNVYQMFQVNGDRHTQCS